MYVVMVVSYKLDSLIQTDVGFLFISLHATQLFLEPQMERPGHHDCLLWIQLFYHGGSS